MFYLLLFSSLITGILVTFITIKIFRGTIKSLIQIIIELDIYEEWLKYITFVMYIIGVSSTFKINELAKYSDSYFQQNIFQVEKLVLNLVGTTINVLQSLAWILFLFYIALLVIIVIFKISANRK